MPLLYVPTIYVLTLSVMALLGVLMLFAWLQNRAIRALAWWSGAVLMMAIALGLLCLRGMIPNFFSLDLAYVLLFTSCGLMLEGARCFENQPRSLLVVFGAAAMWFGVCQAPILYDSVTARTVIVSATIGFYSLSCAYVMWKGRSEPLMSRWPLTVLLALGGVLFLGRIPFAIVYPFAQTAINSVEALQSVWYAIFSASTLLYIVAVYFLFLALAKERTELAHKQAAMTDPLTGLFNRRAFTDFAERRLKQHERDGRPLAFLVFDLDWFKEVNDTHGHAIGDLALRRFAETLRANLRPEDIAGRLGGEEFAAVLSDADQAAAINIAERIREKFAAAGAEIEGKTVEVTVSVGIAYCLTGEAADLEWLAEAADEALYRAKAHGRNRVEFAGDETVTLVPDLPDESVPAVAA